MIKIIESGSAGNAVIYHNEILVDLGLSYKKVQPFLPNIKYLLLTHRHKDHLNVRTIKRMNKEYPDIKIVAPKWLMGSLEEITNVYELEPNTWLQLHGYQVSSFYLEHDVDNVGYRIFKELPDFEFHKTFHATDTYSLFGIEAKDYDLYAVEFNHCFTIINNIIEEKVSQGLFSYEINSRDNHMSNQRVSEWLDDNNKNGGLVVPLHISDNANNLEEVEWHVTRATEVKQQTSQ